LSFPEQILASILILALTLFCLYCYVVWVTNLFGFAVLSAFFILATIFGILMSVLFYPASILLGPIYFGGLVLLLNFAGQHVKSSCRRQIQVYLAHGIESNLPLHKFISLSARSEHGLMRTRMTKLAERLEMGDRLHSAIEAAVPEVPARDIGFIRSLEETGRVKQAIYRLVEQAEQPKRIRTYGCYFSPGWYAVLVLVIATFVLLLSGTLVIPRFLKIFEDFDAPVPNALTVLTYVARWLWGGLSSQVVPGYALLAIVFSAILILPRALNSIYAGRLVRDNLIIRLPFFGRLACDRHLSDLCFVIAEGTSVGLPLLQAAERADHLDVNLALRVRLTNWYERMRSGESPSEAARKAKLPSLFAGILSSSPGSEMEASFRFLSEYYSATFSRMIVLLSRSVQPIVILLISVIVGFIVYALFSPLIVLIWNVTYQTEVYL